MSRSWSLPPEAALALQLSAFGDIVPYFRQANLAGLKGSLECPDLWMEAALLGKLIYKNNSQHRGTTYLRRLRHVLRQLRLLSSMQLPGCFDDLLYLTQLASGTHASGAQLAGVAIGRGVRGGATCKTHRVPAQEAVVAVLARVHAATELLPDLIMAALEAASQTGAQVAWSFFMPLCLTATAMMARVQVLCTQQLLACVSVYNALVTLLPLLPRASQPGTTAASQHAARLSSLPCSLHCALKGPVPHVSTHLEAAHAAPGTAMKGGTGAGEAHDLGELVASQVGQLWEDLGITQGLQAAALAAPGPPSGMPTAVATAGGVGAAASVDTEAAAGARKQVVRAVRSGKPAVSGPSDMGVQVSRTSFFDLMASKQQQQQQGTGRTSGAQPRGALSVIDDRTTRPTARPATPAASVAGAGTEAVASIDASNGASLGQQLDVTVQAAPATLLVASADAVPVYSTGVAGFALGLGPRPVAAAAAPQELLDGAHTSPPPASQDVMAAGASRTQLQMPGSLAAAGTGSYGSEGRGVEDEDDERVLRAANSSTDEDDMVDEGYGLRGAGVLAAATAAGAAGAASAVAGTATGMAEAAAGSASRPGLKQAAFVRVQPAVGAVNTKSGAGADHTARPQASRPGAHVAGTSTAGHGAASSSAVAATAGPTSSAADGAAGPTPRGNRILDIITGAAPNGLAAPVAGGTLRVPLAAKAGKAKGKASGTGTGTRSGKGAEARAVGLAGAGGTSWEDILMMGTQPVTAATTETAVGAKRKGQGAGRPAGGPAAKRR